MGVIAVLVGASVVAAEPEAQNQDTVIPHALMQPGVNGVSSPQLIANSWVPPVAPPLALSMGIEGSVTVAAVVYSDGTMGEVKTLSCTSPNGGFEAAAVNAVKQWHFRPAELAGQPVDSYKVLKVSFKAPGSIDRGPNPLVLSAGLRNSGASHRAGSGQTPDSGVSATGLRDEAGNHVANKPPCDHRSNNCLYDAGEVRATAGGLEKMPSSNDQKPDGLTR